MILIDFNGTKLKNYGNKMSSTSSSYIIEKKCSIDNQKAEYLFHIVIEEGEIAVGKNTISRKVKTK
jgi:hypothetical protein